MTSPSYHTRTCKKKQRLQHFRQQTVLEINNNESNVMPINTNKPEEITIQGQVLDNTDNFTYLGSTIYHNGETSKDIQNRINKGQTTFIRLNPNWKSNQYITKTKLRIYRVDMAARSSAAASQLPGIILNNTGYAIKYVFRNYFNS